MAADGSAAHADALIPPAACILPAVAIHDRDYMRPDPANAWSAPRSATLWILVLQFAAMCAFAAAREATGRRYDVGAEFGRDALAAGRAWTVLTHVFVDRFSIHWAVGAFVWWFFGRMAEEALGRAKFLGFLAAALVAGCAVHIGATFLGAPPRFAPGGVSGLASLTAACLAYSARRDPGRPVFVLFAEIPLRVLALICVAIEAAVAFGFATPGGESVAAIFGAAAYGLAAWKLGLIPDLGSLRGLRSLRGRTQPRNAAARPSATPEQVEARVDALLDKISRSGMSSLTAEEHEYLRQASKRS